MTVYILTNTNNTTLYIGVTNDLPRHIQEHKQKLIPGFSAKYNFTKLVYYKYASIPKDAIAREKYLKKAYRKIKEQLITSLNPLWLDLSSKI